MTPYGVWERNVRERPSTFKMGLYRWRDTKNGWGVWHHSGPLFYTLDSPCGGSVGLSWWEKYKMWRLLKWWTAGALNSGRSTDG